MSTMDDINIDTSPPLQYQQFAQPPVTTSVTNITGPVSPVTTINGGGGQVTGPSITFDGGLTGYDFNAAGNTISLAVSNAATVRTSISAAKSGVNADITQFTGLTGNTGFSAWTGGSDGATHATYPATTASVAYVAAELQGVMDKLKQITEAYKKLVDAGLAAGWIET